jgi:ABC-type uncharacterized transport system permease subunit
MENYIAQFMALVDGVKITTLMSMIFLNFILGVAVSIKVGNFNLKKMGEFLYTRILPYVVSYFGIGVVCTIDKQWQPALIATWAIILAALLGAVLQNLKELGINIPGVLAGGNNNENDGG